MAVATKRKSEMTSYLNNGYDVMNYFAKFEKFLPHGIIIWKSNARVRPGGRGFFAPPPYKLGSQNTPYKLGLNAVVAFLSVTFRCLEEIFTNCLSEIELPHLESLVSLRGTEKGNFRLYLRGGRHFDQK